MVEHNLAKVGVASSNLVSRSKIKRDPTGSLFFVPPRCGTTTCGSGPGPRKVGDAGRQYPRDFYRSRVRRSVSETRCNGGAFRDRSSHPWPLLVWPSLAKQLPPGTTIAPLTGQRNRHGSETPPGPFYKARIVGACLAVEWSSRLSGPRGDGVPDGESPLANAQ